MLRGAKYVLSVESPRFLGGAQTVRVRWGSYFTGEVDEEVRRDLRLRAAVPVGAGD